jgi:hypothetical protein
MKAKTAQKTYNTIASSCKLLWTPRSMYVIQVTPGAY